jgi:hypothetical protein
MLRFIDWEMWVDTEILKEQNHADYLKECSAFIVTVKQCLKLESMHEVVIIIYFF